MGRTCWNGDRRSLSAERDDTFCFLRSDWPRPVARRKCRAERRERKGVFKRPAEGLLVDRGDSSITSSKSFKRPAFMLASLLAGLIVGFEVLRAPAPKRPRDRPNSSRTSSVHRKSSVQSLAEWGPAQRTQRGGRWHTSEE
ncbi:hypothetical protein TNCV_977771 [Trichonephila clavipes]|nr:hypothetical protein TNCV_977771 [Trichonephila clavipes]